MLHGLREVARKTQTADLWTVQLAHAGLCPCAGRVVQGCCNPKGSPTYRRKPFTKDTECASRRSLTAAPRAPPTPCVHFIKAVATRKCA